MFNMIRGSGKQKSAVGAALCLGKELGEVLTRGRAQAPMETSAKLLVVRGVITMMPFPSLFVEGPEV
jgi:hypothetical protein